MTDHQSPGKTYTFFAKLTKPFVYIFPACAVIALVFKLFNFEVYGDGAKAGLIVIYCIPGILFTMSYYFNGIRVYELIASFAVIIIASMTSVETTFAAVAFTVGIIPSFHLKSTKAVHNASQAASIFLGILVVAILEATITGQAAMPATYRTRYVDAPDRMHTVKIVEEGYEKACELKSITVYDKGPLFPIQKKQYKNVASRSNMIVQFEINWLDNSSIQTQWHTVKDDQLHANRFNISSDRIDLE